MAEIIIENELAWIGLSQTIYTDDGVRYVPFVTASGQVGYAVQASDGSQEEFIYLNASTGTDDGQPNVFLYIGTSGDPTQDESVADFNVAEDFETVHPR